MKRPTENQICAAIASRLRLVKPKCFWTHLENEQNMSGVNRALASRIGGIAKNMGKTPGVCDYMFLGMPTGYPIYFYEVKRRGGKLSKPQEMFKEYCDRRGIPNDWLASDNWEDHYRIIEYQLKLTGAI